jgi:hypothetical protein
MNETTVTLILQALMTIVIGFAGMTIKNLQGEIKTLNEQLTKHILEQTKNETENAYKIYGVCAGLVFVGNYICRMFCPKS